MLISVRYMGHKGIYMYEYIRGLDIVIATIFYLLYGPTVLEELLPPNEGFFI